MLLTDFVVATVVMVSAVRGLLKKRKQTCCRCLSGLPQGATKTVLWVAFHVSLPYILCVLKETQFYLQTVKCIDLS